MIPWNTDSAPRRWTIKVGSNVLSHRDGTLDVARIQSIADQIAVLRRRGIEVLLVSSGAVAAGIGLLGLAERPTQVPRLQAVAAVGQGALMARYAHAFAPHQIIPAQMLLTYADMEDQRRHLNLRHALGEVLRLGALPILNENDSTTVEELRFGDNDMLAAMVASKLNADLLVILSSVPGLMDGWPEGRIVPEVRSLDEVDALVTSGRSSFGSGGMRGKLAAVAHATGMGIPVFVGSGMREDILGELLAGQAPGTFFHPGRARRRRNRDHWIATRRPKGALTVDAGAVQALREGRSLLPVGVLAVEGDFRRGDAVEVLDPDGRRVALGLVNHDAEEARRLRGLSARRIAAELGPQEYDEVVHADNLAVFGNAL